MIVTVTERWRIVSDAHCWTIEQRSRSKRKPRRGVGPLEHSWEARTYHETLPLAAKRLGETLSRDDPMETDDLSIALEKVAYWHKQVAEAIEGRSHADK